MNVSVAKIIKDKVESLGWIERCAGLVREFIKVDLYEEGGKIVRIRKTFPVSCDVTNEDCINGGKYTDLVPDSRKRSIVYLEDFGTRLLEVKGKTYRWESNLRLVCWVNMEKFNYPNACSISPQLIVSLLSSIPFSRLNEEGYTNILIRCVGEVPKDSRIFSRYNYDEAVTGYLLHPFDYFALSFKVEFSSDENCFDPIEINDDPVCQPS